MLKTHFWWSWGWFVVLGLPHYLGIPKSKSLPVAGLKLQPRFATPCRFGGATVVAQSFGSQTAGTTEMRKTALITGITGQDGSYLAEFLLEKGCLEKAKGSKGLGAWDWEVMWCIQGKVSWTNLITLCFRFPAVLRDPESNPNSDCRHFGVRSNLLVGMIKTLLPNFSKSPLLTGYWDMLYIYIYIPSLVI